jgi:subtilisin family serine protease
LKTGGAGKNRKKVHLLIGYKNERGKEVIKNNTILYDDPVDGDDAPPDAKSNTRKRKHSKMKDSGKNKVRKPRHGRLQARIPVIAASITTLEELETLENDPDIDFIEEDSLVRLLVNSGGHNGEALPDGVAAIQAPLLYNDANSSGSTIVWEGDCNDPDVIKIGIVDSGSDSSHPDSPCYNAADAGSTVSSSCVGETFGLETGMVWNVPADSHGTMVTGIIGATQGNQQGVVGVIGGAKVCFVVARVFASMTAQALMSDVLEGMEWAVDQGARVINLSLGGPDFSESAQMMYDDLQSRGILVVSAAGNDGTNGKCKLLNSEERQILRSHFLAHSRLVLLFALFCNSDYSFPAAYDSVLGVGAIDTSTNEKASFSNYNDQVDVAAPGVQILSTSLPSTYFVPFLSVRDDTVSGVWWQATAAVSNSLSGILIDCGNGIDSPCETSVAGENPSVCLIKRCDSSYISH